MRLARPVTLVACALLAIGCSRLRGKGGDAGPEASSSATTTASAPVVPTEPGIIPISDPACVLRSVENVKTHSITLRAGGHSYAMFDEPKEIEVRFAKGPNGGTATVKTKKGTFAGEVRLDDVLLFAKKPSAGTPPWLFVSIARPTDVAADKVRVKMNTPTGVQAVMALPDSYPCSDLAIGVADAESGSDLATLKKDGELKTESGEVIAKLAVLKKQKKEGLYIEERPAPFVILERAGKKSKVRILGVDTSYEGWVESAILAKKATPKPGPAATAQEFGMIGLLNTGKPPPPIRVRCAETVGVYVDDGDRTIRVGTLDANGIIESTRTDGIRSFLDLGAHSDFTAMMKGEEFAHPYVKSKTISLCPNATD